MFLPSVSANWECTAATGRIEHDRVAVANAEGVDYIHNGRLRIVLSPPVTFFGAQQILEDVADNILTELPKIEIIEEFY